MVICYRIELITFILTRNFGEVLRAMPQKERNTSLKNLESL